VADGIHGRILGVPELRAALDAVVERSTLHAREAVAEAAHLVEAQAKMNATGRPGPNVQTGYLRRSIVVRGPTNEGFWWSARIGPTAVYGRRVELGFTGTDSLGRTYDQKGYPYLGPAYRYIRGFIPAIFRRHLEKLG
jgi:hypothetical protein